MTDLPEPGKDPSSKIDVQTREASNLNSQLVSWSLGAGLCALIPIPFVDDWAVSKMRRAAYAAIWRKHEASPIRPIHEAVLTGPKKKRGCLSILLRLPLWIAKWLILYPIKKILRKVFFVFAIHDAVNAFSDCYHRAYLLDAAIHADHTPTTERAAFVMHDSIQTVCKEAESRPVIQFVQTVFRRGSRKLRSESLRLYRIMRKDRNEPNPEQRMEATVESEAVTLTPIARELENRLLLEKGYFEALARKLIELLEQAETKINEPPTTDEA